MIFKWQSLGNRPADMKKKIKVACNIYPQYLTLTPMNRIILTKRQVAQFVTKFPVFYIIPGFIIMLTRTWHRTVSDSDDSSVHV
jgi:hypothetical protein